MQVEVQFAARGIIAQCMMYHHTVGSLSPEIATEIRHLLLCPPEDNPYDVLKQKIDRTHCSIRTAPIAAVVHGRRAWGPETHAVPVLNAPATW